MKDSRSRDLARKRYEECLPLLTDYVDHWAKVKPEAIALAEYSTGEQITWKDFSLKTKAFAAKLLAMGLKKGDVVATTLPGLKEHVYLMYACYRIGLIVAPLDLRLKTEEVDRYFAKMKPKAYFFLGETPVMDFRPMIRDLRRKYAQMVPHWIQFQKEADKLVEGVTGIVEFASTIKWTFLKSLVTGSVRRAQKRVSKKDAALIIFTTGSTGEPKPALLSHENIHVQCIGLAVGFDSRADDRMLVNLPLSHVGATTEQLGTILFVGGTAVLIPVFKPEESLDAIQKYKVTLVGQIPAVFNLEWRLPDYKKYDLSSLRFAIYGGQAVSRPFLEQLSRMAPLFGTGLGLTETAGFCTYTPLDGTVDDVLASVGHDSPLCPISIREPMNEDGTAGALKPAGVVGEICFEGPQIFLGYLNDEASTKKTISREGICYTGDLGTYDEKGLHLAGRSKLVIKPKGYQVFPTDVENFVAQRLSDKIANVAVVGAHHEIFSEAILMFVERHAGMTVTPEEVHEAAKGLAAYARPTHVVIYDAGEMPLNRVAKTDYKLLKERAVGIVDDLRAAGRWD